ncbi:MAG: YbaB/EbfC family nucleoid-associated protein [Sedimentisphaerales bacterium]|nr:YbaB/EbfC family nucleoid-associated protein [Sedimentisphaerales bacterium]
MAGLGDLSGMLGKVKDMQANMQRMQEELAQRTVESASGGGMVTATVNGKGDLIAVKIDKSVIDPNDSEMLEDLVKAAVNAAVDKSRQMMQEEMAKMTGGLNLPGLDQIGKMFE